MRILVAMVSAIAALAGTTGHGQHWPHWRGPTHNGVVSGETNLPVTWSAECTPTSPGPAHEGGPLDPADSVSAPPAPQGRGGRWRRRRRRPAARAAGLQQLRDEEHRLEDPDAGLQRLDANHLGRYDLPERRDRHQYRRARVVGSRPRQQSVAWKRPIAGTNHMERKQNMSSPSPVTDGQHVWVMTGVGILKGFDFPGKEIWSRNIQADYGRFGLNWGYASSPLLKGDALYVQVLHGMKTDDPSYVLKIDKMTGKTLWRVERLTDAAHESPDSYTTPTWIEANGRAELIITGGDVVSGHDPATGREYWRADVLNPKRRALPHHRLSDDC